jgi:energy-coupling factor transporter ATP-binding protein EcfA2
MLIAVYQNTVIASHQYTIITLHLHSKHIMDILKIIKDFPELKEKMDKLLHDSALPQWLVTLFSIVLLVIFMFILVPVLLKTWKENLSPLYHDPEQEKRKARRKIFATHTSKRIQCLNEDKQWDRCRFTELEAEVEGKSKQFMSIPFVQKKTGKRRVKSLSKALRTSDEELVLVLGESGSGKSVALRHIADSLSEMSIKYKELKRIIPLCFKYKKFKRVIPLYIDLKELSHSSEEEIDRNLIESFVKKELNAIKDSSIASFLEDEFQVGKEENTWLFLFDSFDEIPAILSSVESDQIISQYTKAIKDFLIVASREFHGPNDLSWSRFRVLPLGNRRWELIKKMKFNPKTETRIIGNIKNASQAIQDMTKNPMFLRILCASLQEDQPFPENAHTVFENYLEKRIGHDADKLWSSFELTPSDIRTTAEKIAFGMLIDPSLGLSADHDCIAASMKKQGFLIAGGIKKHLNALENIHLADTENPGFSPQSKTFTFSHRRFHEYFATCFVLSDLNRVSPRQLLTDGRWRETVVVIFQTQPLEKLSYLLEEAQKILDEKIRSIPGIIDNPIEYISKELINENLSEIKVFNWPSELYSFLMILQDGFVHRIDELPDTIKMKSGQFLLTASVQGTRADRKSSLEIAGITSQPIFLYLLRYAFKSESQWLKEVAYRRISYLKNIPDDIATEIRKSLLYLYFSKRLNKDFDSTYAYLSRLDNSSIYIKSINCLKYLRIIDICLHVVSVLFLALKFSLIFSLAITPLFLVSILLAEDLYSFAGGFLALHKGKSSLNIFKIALAAYVRIVPSLLAWPLFIIYWPLLIIISIKSGKRIGLFPCLLLPFDYIFSIKNIQRILHYLFIPFKTGWFFVLFPIGALISKIILWISQNPSLITVIISLILLIFIMFQSFYDFCHWMKDSIRWQRWLKKQRFLITVEELLVLVNSYHYSESCRKLIIKVRQDGKIENDIEGLLIEMAYTLENSILFRKKRVKEINVEEKDILKTPVHFWRFLCKSYKSRKSSRSEKNREIYLSEGNSDYLKLWLVKFTNKNKMRFVNLGDEFIDELYLLIEQLHAEEASSFNSKLSGTKDVN